jgi:hypothetical protein
MDISGTTATHVSLSPWERVRVRGHEDSLKSPSSQVSID